VIEGWEDLAEGQAEITTGRRSPGTPSWSKRGRGLFWLRPKVLRT
jgi:hypothetical protein